MQGTLRAFALALTAATAAASADQAPAASAESLAAGIRDVRFGLPMAEWKARVPGASWRPFRGQIARLSDTTDDRGVWPSGFWCAVASDTRANVERVAVFFAIRREAPLACRLELVQQVVRGTPEETGALYESLADHLSRGLGDRSAVDLPGEDVPYPWGGDTGYPAGVDRWREGREWQTPYGGVFLFRADSAVGIALRSDAVRDEEDEGSPFIVDPLVTSELAAALGARHAAAADALSIESEVAHQPKIREGLLQVLEARRGATGNTRALLGLAADWLARRLWVVDSPPEQQEALAPILRSGLRFTFDGHDSRWVYDGAFARQVIGESANSRWGELAFLARLQAGWVEECAGQAYRSVIRQGLAWLPRHPGSPWRIPVMTALAQAYETQWSGGDFFTADPALNARAIDAESEAARLQAIQWYDRVIRLAPYSEDAAYARRRVVQIQLNMNTGQDRFSCFIP